jgi:hypothetical protein
MTPNFGIVNVQPCAVMDEFPEGAIRETQNVSGLHPQRFFEFLLFAKSERCDVSEL